MAKVQRRKNLSMSPECHAVLVAAAKRVGIPHTRLAEIILRRTLGMPSVRCLRPGKGKGFEWIRGTSQEQTTFQTVKRANSKPL